MKQSINIQDTFLNQIRKDSVPVTIFLVNGFQIKGIIRGFDNFTIVIDSDGKQQMIHKRYIYFYAARAVSLMPMEEKQEEETRGINFFLKTQRRLGFLYLIELVSIVFKYKEYFRNFSCFYK